MDFGKTIVHEEHKNGYIKYSYEFDGDVFILAKRDLANIGINVPMEKGATRFSIDGNAFIVAEIGDFDATVIFVREAAWKWRAYFFILDPLVNWVAMVYHRMIVTLAVWNLADKVDGEIPNIGWIARRWSRR